MKVDEKCDFGPLHPTPTTSLNNHFPLAVLLIWSGSVKTGQRFWLIFLPLWAEVSKQRLSISNCMGRVNSGSEWEVWLQLDSSPFSCGHILLSVPSVKIYRTYLETKAIFMTLISKSERVKVHAHSVTHILLCTTQREALHSVLDASPSPVCLQRYWWGQKQAVCLVTALTLPQGCTRWKDPFCSAAEHYYLASQRKASLS